LIGTFVESLAPHGKFLSESFHAAQGFFDPLLRPFALRRSSDRAFRSAGSSQACWGGKKQLVRIEWR
jgi:hypothetical protein